MAADTYTEVTSRSWFSRIGGAFKGIIVGLVLMAVAFGLLFWNEGRAVERYKTLKEGGGTVLSVDVQQVDPGNEGRLVHVSGRAETEDTLSDAEFGVQAQAITLIREVEMYQWRESSRSETQKKLGGGEETVTTYNYSKEWSARINNSNNFRQQDGHINPNRMTYQSKTITAENVKLGAFSLPAFLITKMTGEIPLSLGEESPLADNLQGRTYRQDNGFYVGENPDAPVVGDLRVSYRVILPGDISLVARQVGSTFEPFKARAGGSIALLEMGKHAADTMFAKAQQANTFLTWGLRLAGLLLMALGVNMILAPLVVFADVVPAIGSLIGAGTKFISILISGVFSFITIGIAWFFYRPLLGIALIAIAAALTVAIIKRLKKAKPAAVPSPVSGN